jgi:hypothetical protein
MKGSLSATSSVAANTVRIQAVTGAAMNASGVSCTPGQNCAVHATMASGAIDRSPAAAPIASPIRNIIRRV